MRNWHNHLCVGTEVDLSTGLQVRWRQEGSRCLLADGKRCPYFERSVLPMEHWHWKNPSEGVAFKNTAHQYRIQIIKEKTSRPAIRKCPDCLKNTIGPRQRLALHSSQRCGTLDWTAFLVHSGNGQGAMPWPLNPTTPAKESLKLTNQ